MTDQIEITVPTTPQYAVLKREVRNHRQTYEQITSSLLFIRIVGIRPYQVDCVLREIADVRKEAERIRGCLSELEREVKRVERRMKVVKGFR
ncbi:hypothetical protein HDV00_006163 [Rhizophlyctis rosea]|nr:hypothetical protein HDV00_006163 [Rhizophlyctis rosea]